MNENNDQTEQDHKNYLEQYNSDKKEQTRQAGINKKLNSLGDDALVAWREWERLDQIARDTYAAGGAGPAELVAAAEDSLRALKNWKTKEDNYDRAKG